MAEVQWYYAQITSNSGRSRRPICGNSPTPASSSPTTCCGAKEWTPGPPRSTSAGYSATKPAPPVVRPRPPRWKRQRAGSQRSGQPRAATRVVCDAARLDAVAIAQTQIVLWTMCVLVVLAGLALFTRSVSDRGISKRRSGRRGGLLDLFHRGLRPGSVRRKTVEIAASDRSAAFALNLTSRVRCAMVKAEIARSGRRADRMLAYRSVGWSLAFAICLTVAIAAPPTSPRPATTRSGPAPIGRSRGSRSPMARSIKG